MDNKNKLQELYIKLIERGLITRGEYSNNSLEVSDIQLLQEFKDLIFAPSHVIDTYDIEYKIDEIIASLECVKNDIEDLE